MQAELFESLPELPPGMRYQRELVSPDEERALLTKLHALPFKEFEFHGFRGKRRTVSFGWHYDFNGGGLKRAGPLPNFLEHMRNRAAEFAGLHPAAFEHALVIEYKPGAGIGWHRDRRNLGRWSGFRSWRRAASGCGAKRRQNGTPGAHGGTALGIPLAGCVTERMGAQYPTAEDAALLRDVPNAPECFCKSRQINS
jgi:hypothetical protein